MFSKSGLFRVFASLLPLACSQSLGQVVPSKSGALAAWRNNWSAVSDIEVEFSRRNVPCDADRARGMILLTHSEYRASLADHRFYWRVAIPDVSTMEASYDPASGESRKTVTPGAVNVSKAVNLANGGGEEFVNFLLMSPYPAGSPELQTMVSLEAMLADENSSIREQSELVDGRACAVLDWRLIVGGQPRLVMTVWLDPSRNCVPLRWMHFPYTPDVITLRVDLREYFQIGSTWIPQNLEMTFDSGTHSVLSLSASDDSPGIRLNSDVRRQSVFVELPPRTVVTNVDNMTATQVDNDGKLVTLASVPDAERAFAFGRGARGPELAFSATAGLMIGLVAVGAACGALVWSRRKTRVS